MIVNPGSSTEKKEETGVGRSMAGQMVEPTQGATVTAGDGAEVFNDYRKRAFNANGTPATGNVASGVYSHAEGQQTTAEGYSSHAEGYSSSSSGSYAHAEGIGCRASGSFGSHAEGYYTKAKGTKSHASGENTVAYARQTVVGSYNVEKKTGL